MWDLTNRFNVLNKNQWLVRVNDLLMHHEEELVRFIHEEGYDQSTVHERWTYPSALMFSLRFEEISVQDEKQIIKMARVFISGIL